MQKYKKTNKAQNKIKENQGKRDEAQRQKRNKRKVMAKQKARSSHL